MTHILGLTGSIGMGKSTTAQMFRDQGVPVWDADATVHALYAKGGAAVDIFRQELPDTVINDEISRDVLKHHILADSNFIQKIERLVHPLIAKNRQDFLNSHDNALIVMDIPLLFETGADAWLTSVLVVTAPSNVQEKRVLARSGMTKTQFDLITARQMPDAEKRRRADYIIETQTHDQTRKAVQDLIAKLMDKANA